MLKNSRKYKPTYILIAVNTIIYAVAAFMSKNPFETSDSILLSYGQYNPLVLQGQAWRLITSIFIHANIAHILGNMLFLFIFGLRAEDLFDITEYFLIYVASGLVGNLLTLALWPASLSVGASGAIFGILGACTIYVRRTIGQSIISALIYAFFLFMMNLGPNVNYLAHLGGLVAGLLIGYTLAATRKPRQTITYHYNYPTYYGE